MREAGPADAPAILFLHGWSQSSLSFDRQFSGPLAGRFRLVAPDLRGHGASDRPADPEATDSAVWAEDIAAVIAALDLGRPLAVGWSMGGWIIGDMLRHLGPVFGGIVTIGSVARIGAAADPAMMARRKPDVRAAGMMDDDPAAQIAAAIAFARAMTAAPLSKRDLAWHVALMMACPPAMRRAARQRDEDWRADFARHREAGLPALVLQGGAERVCFEPQARETAEALGADLRLIPGAGHMPFWEQTGTVDAAIAEFADQL